jgi:hypothetical protein
MRKDRKRYQECNRLIKLWRQRWYLLVPFKYLYHTYIKKIKVYHDKIVDLELIQTDEYSYITGKELWSLLVGSAQMKMNYYFTTEEVFNKLNNNE